ncbi:DUF6232 family protein [Streptomyces shaanxiensis]|uniref:PH domain-containing protein n=1 Tax=Streptomyces shaanxiensis TaxID=653357 RepID=A0ABP7UU67_9ACTN
MAKERVGHIVISKRVVQIGHEVYPLANISRVQTLQVYWGGKYATLYPLRQIAAIVLVVGAVVGAAVLVPPRLPPSVDSDIGQMARQFAAVLSAVAGVVVAYWLVILLYRIFFRRRRYALVIETAGTQYTALSGTDYPEIHRIRNVIVGAIENPPAQATSVQVHGDVVMGDKVGRDQHKQTGSGNRMYT